MVFLGDFERDGLVRPLKYLEQSLFVSVAPLKFFEQREPLNHSLKSYMTIRAKNFYNTMSKG